MQKPPGESLRLILALRSLCSFSVEYLRYRLVAVVKRR